MAMLAAPFVAQADEVDSEGRPVMYVLGGTLNQWTPSPDYRMTREGDYYSITLPMLTDEFKVSSSEWAYNYGAEVILTDANSFKGVKNGPNMVAEDLHDVTIRFKMTDRNPDATYIYVDANGHKAPEIMTDINVSGTLPILYINVYNEDGTTYNDEINDRNLGHKNYFTGEYWLDVNGCKWLEELGAESIGSKDEPLPLEIKARGNFTRLAFAKKPFKLKLGKKQSLLGMSKSKHYAILAHADDGFGYLRNFTGFDLGKRIGLPWTPSQQPVEVIINGDYRGLYFLTESIRVEENRVDITELADNETTGNLISGGYLVELDNYDEENQIRMEEKTCAGGYIDMLRVTFDTPEVYSDIQRRFITEQFSTMNDLVGANSDNLWAYMDLDDAARYYLVEEIISHTESYHGSTYMFRNYGENQKWHFSPLWDCGNAFNGSTSAFLYNDSPFGNTWIPSMRCNDTFNDKVRQTWLWFMTSNYDGLFDDIDAYVEAISKAAQCDYARWHNAPVPDYPGAQSVADNRDMTGARDRVVAHLNAKTDWLKCQFGDYSTAGVVAEPARDTTPAAALPEYARPGGGSIEAVGADTVDLTGAEYYDLQGMRVTAPQSGRIYIAVTSDKAVKVRF